MKVDIERVVALRAELKAINDAPLEDIEWQLNGEPFTVSPQVVKEFACTGLNNADFITTGIYQHETIYTNKGKNFFDR
jgi:hypothetical protein